MPIPGRTSETCRGTLYVSLQGSLLSTCQNYSSAFQQRHLSFAILDSYYVFFELLLFGKHQ
jgi:hypothetical protein